jgi:predicted TIM-barrel fold metal-dependent hydrolase
MYRSERFPYAGTIDADGHVLEPAWLWERYLEPKFRERAIRIRTDADGLEYLELDGRPSERTVKGSLGLMGAMGDEGARPSPERRYMEHIPFGAADPGQRVELLERENLAAALLYPTIQLLWECEVTDPALSLAYCRAYNRWIADFCRDSNGRLVPIAHLSLLDPEGAAAELARAVADGCRGGWVAPFTHSRKGHGHPDHDPLWRKAVELDVPVAIHPTYEPVWSIPVRFNKLGRAGEFHYNVTLRQGVQQALLTFLDYGTLERLPSLRLGVLESGMGWLGPFLDRCDAVFATISGRALPLRTKPSEVFARQCFISGDPDETAAPLLFEHVGAHLFMWATDYPHPDHPSTWVEGLTRQVAGLHAATRDAYLGGNVRRIYGL